MSLSTDRGHRRTSARKFRNFTDPPRITTPTCDACQRWAAVVGHRHNVLASQAGAGLRGPRNLRPAYPQFLYGRPVAEIPDWQLSVTVHQASGMVASQLESDVPEALRRMRALADETDETLEHVARGVLDRTITFAP